MPLILTEQILNLTKKRDYDHNWNDMQISLIVLFHYSQREDHL